MSKYYRTFDFYNMESEGNFHILPHFKTKMQTTPITCGPTCVMMVMSYLGMTPPGEQELANLCKTREGDGTRLLDLVNALKQITEHKILSTYDLKDKDDVCFKTYEEFKAFMIKSIDSGIPTIMENCDYGGHYRVLIGFDEVNPDNPSEDIAIFADPSDYNDGCEDGYTYVPAERFFYMWFDDRRMDKGGATQGFVQIIPEEK